MQWNVAEIAIELYYVTSQIGCVFRAGSHSNFHFVNMLSLLLVVENSHNLYIRIYKGLHDVIL